MRLHEQIKLEGRATIDANGNTYHVKLKTKKRHIKEVQKSTNNKSKSLLRVQRHRDNSEAIQAFQARTYSSAGDTQLNINKVVKRNERKFDRKAKRANRTK
tara:strand:+ start:141 stop:443 length:303 start_codon:yes stop_codon:yes gene_type:complete